MVENTRSEPSKEPRAHQGDTLRARWPVAGLPCCTAGGVVSMRGLWPFEGLPRREGLRSRPHPGLRSQEAARGEAHGSPLGAGCGETGCPELWCWRLEDPNCAQEPGGAGREAPGLCRFPPTCLCLLSREQTPPRCSRVMTGH